MIGPELPGRATQSFTIKVQTEGAEAGNKYVNLAEGRAATTQLLMRTSGWFDICPTPALTLKKYVWSPVEEEWVDANEQVDYPNYTANETVKYKVVVTNDGDADLEDVLLTDNQFDLCKLYDGDSLAYQTAEEQTLQPWNLDGACALTLSVLPADENSEFQFTYSILAADLELNPSEDDADPSFVNEACATVSVDEQYANAPQVSDDLTLQACDPAGITVRPLHIDGPKLPLTGGPARTAFFMIGTIFILGGPLD